MDGIIDMDGRETEIGFSEGKLTARNSVISLFDADGALLRAEDFSEICAKPLHAGADMAIIKDFCDAIAGRTQTRCSLRDALPGLEACFGVEDSLLC